MNGIRGGISTPTEAAKMAVNIKMYLKRLPSNDTQAHRIKTTRFGTLSSSGHPEQHQVFTGEKYIIAIAGRPYWGLDARRQNLEIFAQEIHDDYEKHGTKFLEHINGQFQIAILNTQEQSLLIATDKYASMPLYYHQMLNGLVFSFDLPGLATCQQISPTISEQSVFDYFYNGTVTGTESIYDKFYRLMPHQYLYYKDHMFKVRDYWQPDYTRKTRRSFADLASDFTEVLKDRIPKYQFQRPAGSFLIGDLDSATVSGCLAQGNHDQTHAFSIGYNTDEFDDLFCARAAARHFNMIHHHDTIGPDHLLQAIPLIAEHYAQPYGKMDTVVTYFGAQLAANNGMKLLLAGIGGDELFGGNPYYGKQQRYRYYEYVPDYLKQPLERIFKATGSNTILPGLGRYLTEARLPLPDRLESHNLLNLTALDQMFASEFYEKIDPAKPLNYRAKLFFDANTKNEIERMLAMDMTLKLTDSALPSIQQMCALAGVEVAFPLLDPSIVHFAEQLPVHWKVKGRKLRGFFKEALDYFLPKETLGKKQKYYKLPFELWLKKHSGLRDYTFDQLNALKNRNIIRPGYLDALMNQAIQGPPAQAASFMWTLMMFELWYQRHEQKFDTHFSVASESVLDVKPVKI